MAATIIMVHGRSQQFTDPLELEVRFENNLLAGLSAGGVSPMPAREQLLFPYYGDLYENYSLALERSVTVEEKRQRLLFERQIAERIRDKMAARRIMPLPAPSNASLSFFDPLLDLLDRVPGLGQGTLRWFTRDVYDYLHNAGGIRDRTMLRVLAPIRDSQGQGNPLIVIGHSMGCIITYDILNTHPNLRVDLYVTLGCPLGITNAVRNQLLRDAHGELGVPAGVNAWVNLADPDDVVALDETMGDDFLRHGAPFVRDVLVRNPAPDHHLSDSYLRQPALTAVVSDVLRSDGLLTAVPGVEAVGRWATLPVELVPERGMMAPLRATAGLRPTQVRASLQIAEDLQARGVAPVIVILNDAPPAAGLSLASAMPVEETLVADRGIRAARAKSIADSLLAAGIFVATRGPGASLALAEPETPAAGHPPRLRTRTGATVDGIMTPSDPKIYPNLGMMLGTVDINGLAQLRSDPRVRDVVGAPVISLIRPIGSTAAVSAAAVTWGLRRLGIPQLWAQGLSGVGILVGHLDTGIEGSHPAFAANADFPKAIRTFVKIDDFGTPPVAGTNHAAEDSEEHGTHTAGTIAARPINGRAFGVAPGAQLLGAMVIEAGNPIARILAGLDWILQNGARVLSLSLGFRGYRDDFLPVMEAVLERGVLPIIAVGNEGVGTSRSPGNYQRILSVGASDENDRVAKFSSSQTLQAPFPNRIAPDVVAPGVDVLSAAVDGGTRLDSGSSMATPHIAGLAALLMQACPVATPRQVQDALYQSCTLPATMQQSRANRGMPSGPAALAYLRGLAICPGTSGPGTPPPTLVPFTAATETPASAAAARPGPQPKRKRAR